MMWWQLVFTCDAQQAGELATQLEEVGAIAVTLCAGSEEALCEASLGCEALWQVSRLTGLFPGAVDVGEIVKILQDRLAPNTLPAYTVATLADRDWSVSWRSHFRPLRFGNRIWIGPSWHRPPTADTINIVLDPGQAFGTGNHATTALCLEWLASADLHGAQVIDYGCGSGILAVAAVKLGARHVFAVDTDPRALSATEQNATRNGVQGAVKAARPEALSLVGADLLLANILAGPLIALAPRFAALVRSGGWVVLCGILEVQEDAVADACKPWFRISGRSVREGWVRILGQRLAQ